PAPTAREPFGPLDREEAQAMLEEARLVDDPLLMDPETVRERFEDLIRRRSEQGVENPEQAVAKVKALGRAVSSESVNEIADYMGYQATEYQPRDPPPEGPFQFHDAIIYDLEKVRRDDGTSTYRLTMVDRAGRTHSFVLPKEYDPAQYDRLYDIYQAAKQNPALMVIVRRMAMPLIVKLTQQARPPRQAGPPHPGPDPAAKRAAPREKPPAPSPTTEVPPPPSPPRPPAAPPSPRKRLPDAGDEW
ncbi:MAG: hypothetical protein ACODAJ_15215, partial [Planctomycetota bacterium]